MSRMSRAVAQATTLILFTIILSHLAIAVPMPQGTPTPSTTTPTPTTPSPSASPSTSSKPVGWKHMSPGDKAGLIIGWIAMSIPALIIGGYIVFGIVGLLFIIGKWLWECVQPLAKGTVKLVGSISAWCKTGSVSAWNGIKSGVSATRAAVTNGTNATRRWAANRATSMADSMRRPPPPKPQDIEMTPTEAATEAAIDKKLAEVMAEVETNRKGKRKADSDHESTIAPSYRTKDDVPDYPESSRSHVDEAPAYPASESESSASSEGGYDFVDAPTDASGSGSGGNPFEEADIATGK
ncbi:uncharacterized protein LOC62_06G007829 [Vanrija pseudolonga]|uniref:Mid2 domain-containing protein n=1 Tax=Vanrija pseudolonga TaxID=143232 RepID=A0AAF1BK70_9TREE|nr:hypothetical protein LOC62_06G007829 [Vanrija pseudolonga]